MPLIDCQICDEPICGICSRWCDEALGCGKTVCQSCWSDEDETGLELCIPCRTELQDHQTAIVTDEPDPYELST